MVPVEIKIEVDPFLGKVRVRAVRHKGSTHALLSTYLATLERVSHLYTLKERIEKGYKLTDCTHPKARLKRTRHGTVCTKCGSKMNKRQIKRRAEPLREIRRKLASAPVVRRSLLTRIMETENC